MNTYKKYCPNVFIAECTEKHNKGDMITLTTKRGKENEHIVHNLVGYTGTKDNLKYCYSITRLDGFNNQERAKNRANRRSDWANSADNKSDAYYDRSNKDRDFLILGEPIKVGHHSERRHRKMFEDAHRNIGKSIEFQDKAEEHRHKAEYWEKLSSKIDLSMPDSSDFFAEQLEHAKEYHVFLKDNPDKREHSMSLQYAKNKVNDLEKKVKTSNKLWGYQEEIKPKEEQKKTTNPLGDFNGLFFAFNKDQFKKGMLSIGLEESDTAKILSIGHGGFLLKSRKEAFKKAVG